MMKMLLPSLSILIFMKLLNMHMITSILTLMMILMKSSNNKMMMSSQFLLDPLSLIMISLTIMSVSLILTSSNSIKEIMITIPTIMLILIITFSLSNIFYFYIFFEMVLIPTMILIMKSGNQPERLQAGIYLLMYTVTASLPLLANILLMNHNTSFIMTFMLMYNSKMVMLLILAFLVKMPMFFFHLWLPKAHVEAPLEGSMILAAVLLKLGGYGLIRIFPMCMSKMNSINPWIISISLLGATATGLNCIRQKDLKSLIAYSSVAHMGLVLSSIFSINHIGLLSAIMMMIAHGMSSSALFFLVNDLYLKIHSRNITLFKGLMTITPNIAFWWFIFMAMNISAPPSINTISEIFIMSSLIMWSKFTILPIITSSLMTASFSLSIFINISHNKNNMLPFKQSKQKMFLSLMMHLTPMIIMTMKMELMYM